jgi:putative effector of murein hydrolase
MSAAVFHDAWTLVARSPLPWLTLTLLAYAAAVWLFRRGGGNPFLIPVLTAVAMVVAVLLATRTPYGVYAEGTRFLTFLVGPATVALAVGSMAAIFSAVLVAWALGGSLETLVSLAPKSATMPIAMPVAQRFGGLPSLAAVAVAITGIVGTIMSRPLLDLLRVRDPAARGFAIGITAHAIGMAREIQGHPTAGAFAALAMGLNGVATALLMPLAVGLLQRAGVL